MSTISSVDFTAIREAMAGFDPAPRIEPNDQSIGPDRVFMPEGHRAVLDLSRQLVVGNRGMGKSFWTHALTASAVRDEVAKAYSQPMLNKTEVVIGFNGADKLANVAPTKDAIARALGDGFSADDIWRAVIYRAMRHVEGSPESQTLRDTLDKLRTEPDLYDKALSAADDHLAQKGQTVLIIFDALDRLADGWQRIDALTISLLKRALGLKSFRSFRSKIFMRPDQYAHQNLFQFPDGSKLKSDHVDLSWKPDDLFGLLLFEITRRGGNGKITLERLAEHIGASAALRFPSRRNRPVQEEQKLLIDAIAGQYMGSDARRGRVYTWVPLHLSDAQNACSPRTFLTAWQKAARHTPAPEDKAVDHKGLQEGVRQASTARLDELREDYRWIDTPLKALRDEFVPIKREDLFHLWKRENVVGKIVEGSPKNWLAPIELTDSDGEPESLLETMKNIAVMEERANGKINVPDIFRVEAGIKRKGGVAVPRRG
jgi:hypothetical protein